MALLAVVVVALSGAAQVNQHFGGSPPTAPLDINPEWTSDVLYHQPTSTHPGATNLLPTMHRSPSRYSSVSARDFVTLHAR